MIFRLIETVYNAVVFMAYASAILWAISAIVVMIHNRKNRRK